MKTGGEAEAIDMCSQVLNDDPDNAKILARRGKCSHKLATGKHKHSTVAERKVYARNAEEDYIRCLDILSKKGELDRASAKMKKEVEGDLHEIRTTDESWYTRVFENMSGKHDGKAMQSGLLEYLMQRLTPLGEHKRIPMSSMKEEMLALRLLASLEIKVSKTPIKDDRVVGETEYVDGQEKGWEILNSILTVVAQAPFCLYPATGSSQRRPPITIHLLAFFTRTCLTDKFLDKIGLEEFCTEHTSPLSATRRRTRSPPTATPRSRTRTIRTTGTAKHSPRARRAPACRVPFV